MNKKTTKLPEQNRLFSLSAAEKRRYDDIVQIQDYLAQGFSATSIRNIMKTTFNRIRRYAMGDPDKMCRYRSGPSESKFEPYRQQIIDGLKQNLIRKDILAQITNMGATGKLSAFNEYCNKIIGEVDIDVYSLNAAGIKIDKSKKAKVHYISSSEVFKHLWSNGKLDDSDKEYLFGKYPVLHDIKQIIIDFKSVFSSKDAKMLELFIEVYHGTKPRQIAAFVNGLARDFAAVSNAVTSPLSNGYVEGINNKVKVIKRDMYGRAGKKLLEAKVVLGCWRT